MHCSYDAETSRDYDGGLTCLIQTDSDFFKQDSFKCDVIDPVQCSFNGMFEEHEELISNIVQVSRTDEFDVTAVKVVCRIILNNTIYTPDS